MKLPLPTRRYGIVYNTIPYTLYHRIVIRRTVDLVCTLENMLHASKRS